MVAARAPAYGLDFPAAGERLDRLQVTIETLRALWAPGTKAYQAPVRPAARDHLLSAAGRRRAHHRRRRGERRTLRIVAEQADGANLPSDPQTLLKKIEILHEHCAAVGRDPATVEITVLDLPIIGTDREDVAVRVERLRGRTPAAAFAARHHAGPADDHAGRYRELAALGVGTIFLALPDLAGANDLTRCAPLFERA